LPVPELSGLSLIFEGLHETGDGEQLTIAARPSLLGLHLCAFARGKDGFLDRAAMTGGKVQPAD
jgi:hypothetical protein